MEVKLLQKKSRVVKFPIFSVNGIRYASSVHVSEALDLMHRDLADAIESIISVSPNSKEVKNDIYKYSNEVFVRIKTDMGNIYNFSKEAIQKCIVASKLKIKDKEAFIIINSAFS